MDLETRVGPVGRSNFSKKILTCVKRLKALLRAINNENLTSAHPHGRSQPLLLQVAVPLGSPLLLIGAGPVRQTHSCLAAAGQKPSPNKAVDIELIQGKLRDRVQDGCA